MSCVNLNMCRAQTKTNVEENANEKMIIGKVKACWVCHWLTQLSRD